MFVKRDVRTKSIWYELSKKNQKTEWTAVVKEDNDSFKLIAKKNFSGIIGAYPNVGYYEKPHWIYEDNMRPEDYLIQAKSWVKNGSQIIGGCCGIGPDLIKSLSNLKL